MGVRDWFATLVGGASAVVPVSESIVPGLDYQDPDLDLPGAQAAQNWRRLTQTAADLSPLTQDRMQDLALYLVDRNPLARGVVDLMAGFIVGDGFSVTSKDPDVQETIRRFWDDGANEMDQRLEDLTRELATYGEQLLLAFVNETSGRVALVSVDPRAIRSVVPHPLASDRVYAVALKGERGTEADARWVKVIAEDDDPHSDTFGRLVGARAGETLSAGERAIGYYQPPGLDPGTRLVGGFFFPVNKPRSAMRGRSDLLPVADFVDLYDRLIFDEAERMSFLRAFVWDVKVTGADAATLAQRAVAEPPPKPGSVKLHNESEEWTAVSPDLNSDDSQQTADLILSLVATGVGLPKVWLNGIMDANRATAAEMGEPAFKRLQARQRYVRRAVERIVRFVLDQAEIAGALKPADDGRHPFQVSVPDMSAKDLERAARSLLTTAQALGMANAARWIDDQTAQEALALLLAQLGIDVELGELRERLQAAADAAAEEEDERIPDYFGMGAFAGSDSLTRALGGTGAERRNGTADGGAPPPAPAVPPATKELASVIDTITKSLVALGNARVIDGQFAQEVVAKLYGALGVPVDVAAMQARLEAEEEEAAAEQVAAEEDEGAADDLPEDADDLIDLDALALEETAALGGGDLAAGLVLLAEAFDASLHPRGPGGKFAKKATSSEETDSRQAEIEARAKELAAELIAKQQAEAEKPTRTRKPKDPNAPKKPRSRPKNPAMKQKDLRAEIEALRPGRAVEIELTNGLTVRGTVEVTTGGVAMLRTTDGGYAVLHDRLKGVARLKTPSAAASGSQQGA